MTKKLSSQALIAAALFLAVPSAAFAQPRFLALGDSYTIGTAVTEDQRWPSALVALMKRTKVSLDAPDIIAENGWSTADLLAGIAARKPQGPYNLVTLMIGVNNQFRRGSLEAYRKDLATLLAQARVLAGGNPKNVMVISIPDWGVTPFAEGRDRAAIGAEIDAFNKVLFEEARKTGAHFVNVTTVSRQAAQRNDMFAADGLHPSATLHGLWARLMYANARVIIDRQK